MCVWWHTSNLVAGWRARMRPVVTRQWWGRRLLASGARAGHSSTYISRKRKTFSNDVRENKVDRHYNDHYLSAVGSFVLFTKLAVVLCRIHSKDVGNDRVNVDGADQGGEKQLLHQSGLERTERWEPQQQPWESIFSLFVPRLRHVRPQLFHSLVLKTLHLTASRPRVIYRFSFLQNTTK